MTQETKNINSHIEKYLDYYCNLPHAPGFAILLKGEWGSGKTWFINKYREKLEPKEDKGSLVKKSANILIKLKNHALKIIPSKNVKQDLNLSKDAQDKQQRYFYVSLYGITNFLEIEDIFFQQLRPFWSSKEILLIKNIATQALKLSLKVDLNRNNKDDETLNLAIPDINLNIDLKKIENSVLIFDDLERCNIELSNILGYINYFVEHQGLKVIILANEEKLFENNNYKFIKEKLIGKTFAVSPDFDGALDDFINDLENADVTNFLSENKALIKNVYVQAEYKNLRCLKQITLDFERIFKELTDKVRSKSEILQDVLQLLIIFSIEIKRGVIIPENIMKLEKKVTKPQNQTISSNQTTNTEIQEDDQVNIVLDKMIDSYKILKSHIYQPLLTNLWWYTFFDKGLLNTEALNQSLLNSNYFKDENTPGWRRLWNNHLLTDTEFEDLLKKVESQYLCREFEELVVVKHITGLFFQFSHVGLYKKSKSDILADAKLYINHLKDIQKLDISFRYVSVSESLLSSSDGYRKFAFQGQEIEEFKQFCDYIDEVRQLAQIDSIPTVTQNLLSIMETDIYKFEAMITSHNLKNGDVPEQKFDQFPILKYIKESDFIEKLLLLSIEDQRWIFSSLIERYKLVNVRGYEKLLEELAWLKEVQRLLLEEVNRREGKPSGYYLKSFNQEFLDELIKNLEAKG
ncbi:MAG TPA: P-loop NTPase fold protein [Nostocaceae cyanobacterium]|nr:P-loop NTPase fold protein [Nostocaceae cyanobacterium]